LVAASMMIASVAVQARASALEKSRAANSLLSTNKRTRCCSASSAAYMKINNSI
jgi:hypothetical protein